MAGQISPDSRWMAYASNESGTDEIYIQSFPGPGGKWQVSSGGGAAPRWRGDGRELFYFSPVNKLMAVSVSAGTSLVAGTPTPLFECRLKGSGQQVSYDASADGQRFLINRSISDEISPPMTLVENWVTALKR